MNLNYIIVYIFYIFLTLFNYFWRKRGIYTFCNDILVIIIINSSTKCNSMSSSNSSCSCITHRKNERRKTWLKTKNIRFYVNSNWIVLFFFSFYKIIKRQINIIKTFYLKKRSFLSTLGFGAIFWNEVLFTDGINIILLKCPSYMFIHEKR